MWPTEQTYTCADGTSINVWTELALLTTAVAALVAALLYCWMRPRRRMWQHRTGIRLPMDDPDPKGLTSSDLSKDTTGCMGRVVWPAAEVMCDFLTACDPAYLRSVPSAVELGSGVGVPGMLAAKLGVPSITLTDYHPCVVDALRDTVAINGLSASCTVQPLDWSSDDASDDAPRTWPLALGADLTWTTRGATDLARAVARVLGWERGGGRESVFLYSHVIRRSVYRDAKGAVQREAHDSALHALCKALAALGAEAGISVVCRELCRVQGARSVQGAGCRGSVLSERSGSATSDSATSVSATRRGEEDEPVVLLAFGSSEAVAAVEESARTSAAAACSTETRRRSARSPRRVVVG